MAEFAVPLRLPALIPHGNRAKAGDHKECSGNFAVLTLFM